jgi:hypothetical protein
MDRRLSAYSVTLFAAGTAPAAAYLDPGTGSILLQGLIAGVAAGWAMLSIYGQKLKATMSRWLGRTPPKSLDK